MTRSMYLLKEGCWVPSRLSERPSVALMWVLKEHAFLALFCLQNWSFPVLSAENIDSQHHCLEHTCTTDQKSKALEITQWFQTFRIWNPLWSTTFRKWGNAGKLHWRYTVSNKLLQGRKIIYLNWWSCYEKSCNSTTQQTTIRTSQWHTEPSSSTTLTTILHQEEWPWQW